jgi:hypothetical protein
VDTNQEPLSIEWDKESGLPTKVVIHRNASDLQGSLSGEYADEETWSLEWDKEAGVLTKVVIRNAAF